MFFKQDRFSGGRPAIEEYIFQVRTFSRISPTVCLEIGALDGEYSRLLANAFGLAEKDMFLVEPNPTLVPELRRRFPRSSVLPFAVAMGATKAEFHVVQSDERFKLGCSSMLQRVDPWASHLNYSMMSVGCISGTSLLERINQPVDLCIVDVEGAAFDVLQSFDVRICEIRTLLVECEHAEIFSGQKLFPEIEGFLKSRGFEMMAFRYSYANQSDSIWIQKKFVDLAYRSGR